MKMRAHIGDVPRLLDLSRTVARGATQAPTGIDRAERAYLSQLIDQQSPVFGLVRTGAGYLLLDRQGLAELRLAVTDASQLGRADFLSRILHRGKPARAKFETHARRLAIERTSRRGLGGLLQRRLPAGIEYLNVGHSDLTGRVFRALSRVPRASSTVALHDLLPLTHPQFNRAVAARKARRMVQVISENADRVVHISDATRASNESMLSQFGRVPPGITAPLGARTPLAAGTRRDQSSQPYFLSVGTLEPRKNLGFLLNLWDAMVSDFGDDLPTLVLAGARGWESDEFYERLVRHPLFETKIRWVESPDDEEIDSLLLGARALLFPSHAEGQGLPPLEAASAGVPVICQSLPQLSDALGNYAYFASCDDLAGWIEKIKGLLAGQTPQRLTVPDTLPTWERHFAVVFDGEEYPTADGRAGKESAVCV